MADNKWEGLDAALGKLRGLPDQLRRSGFQRAGTKAMAVVRKAAVAKARTFDDPATTASIAENIVTRAGSRKDVRRYGGNVVVTKVGVQGGAKTSAKQTFSNSKKNQKRGVAGQEYSVGHWRHLEFGTVNMQAQPFMRPALESNVDAVITTYSQSLSGAIDAAVKAAAKRAAKKAGG